MTHLMPATLNASSRPNRLLSNESVTRRRFPLSNVARCIPPNVHEHSPLIRAHLRYCHMLHIGGAPQQQTQAADCSHRLADLADSAANVGKHCRMALAERQHK